jgi:predicted permease
MSDLRLAFRSLRHNAGLSAIVIVSLALGLGANTAIFSLLDQVLLRSLPVQNPQELVFFYQPGPVTGRVSSDEEGMPVFTYLMFRELQQKQTPFTGIAGARGFTASISYANRALPGGVHLVSGNYFSVLGVRPAMGRLLTEEDDREPAGNPVCVLSHAYWNNQLGGRPDVLNQEIIVNGYRLTIVGVAQPGFTSETLGRTPQVFVPISMKPQMTPGWDGTRSRTDYWVTLFARLKPGVTAERAAQEILPAYRAILAEDVNHLIGPAKETVERFRNKRIVLRDGAHGRGFIRKESEAPLYLLMAITVMVLLIACANAANLLLARAAARRREIAVRLSLGAGRARLLRQLLTESCLMALLAGLAGLLIAAWTLDAVLALAPASANDGWLKPTLDVRVLLYCLGASLLTGLAFGVVPAWQATRPDVVPALRDQGNLASGTGPSRYFRNALVGGQVAVSLMLLITTGLLLQSLVNLTRVNLGIDSTRMITFTLEPRLSGYTAERSHAFYTDLEERLKALPGVKMVAASSIPFLTGDSWQNSLSIEGRERDPNNSPRSASSEIGPGLLATMSTPLLQGREFTTADHLNAPKVAIVNESFVKQWLGGGNPIGRRFGVGWGPGSKTDIEIVGVARNAKYSDLRRGPEPMYFVPYRQRQNPGSLTYYVRVGMDTGPMMELIRREVAKLDPTVPVAELKTMEAQVQENMFIDRIVSLFSGSFAALATLLAAIGLYGTLSYTVSRRRKEIGIRMALGAQPGDIRRLIVRNLSVLLGGGTAVGLGAALLLGRYVETILYGVKARDPLILAAASAFLLLIALLAGSVPAGRAAKTDPMVALRYE